MLGKDNQVSKDDSRAATAENNSDKQHFEDIKPRLNKLPWESDSVRQGEDYEQSQPKNQTERKTANTDDSMPYAVGVRTYATQQTAINSAANEKLFAMGVDEYEEDRSRIRVFFDVLFGKIWKLMTLNLLTGLFNLPALLFMIFFAIYYMQLIQPAIFTEGDPSVPLSYLLVGYLPLGLLFLSIPIVAFGPAQAGMHYIIRSYSNEVPVFLWSDFKEKLRENLKQGIIVSFINLIVFILAVIGFYLYPLMVAQTGMTLLLIANYLLIIAFVVFLMVSLYVYPMMVRYDLSLKNLYRNAFLIAVGRVFSTLFVLILCAVLSFGPFLIASLINHQIAMFVAYAYQLFLGLTLPGLIIGFILNPIMDKLMEPKEPEETEAKVL